MAKGSTRQQLLDWASIAVREGDEETRAWLEAGVGAEKTWEKPGAMPTVKPLSLPDPYCTVRYGI